MTEKGLLNYVKSVIHSLVVSSPDRMSVERLKRDYANEEGMPVPFIKLGFRDIEGFLHSISDTVMVQGFGPMATVTAKRKASTAHIQNLVQGQKKPSSKSRGRGPQRPRYVHYTQRSDIVFVNERYNARYRQQFNNNYNYSQSTQQYQNQAPADSLVKSFTNMRIMPVDESSSSDEEFINEIYVPEGVLVDLQNKSNNDENERRNDQSTDESYDKDAVKPNNHSNKENDRNLINSEVAPKICTKEIEPVQYVSSDEGSNSEAIPAYAVDERVLSLEYPKDVMRFDHKLPDRNIRDKFQVGNRIEVQLVMVSSPHNFNFWLHDDEYEDYKNMASNLQQYYNEVHEIKYSIPLFLIMPGHLGAVNVRRRVWHRVKVLNTKTNSRMNIEVELVDTGERLWIPHTELKYLSKCFATLPPQCWPGRLACVRPRHGSFFSVEASNYFYDLVCYRRLYAKIDQIREEDNTSYMVLVDPDDSLLTKNINVALIESGWVRRSFNP